MFLILLGLSKIKDIHHTKYGPYQFKALLFELIDPNLKKTSKVE